MSSDLRCIPERLSGALQQRPSHPQDSKESYDDLTHGPGPSERFPEVDLSDDVIINEHDTKTDGTMVEPVPSDESLQLKVKGDEDFDLQTMFYLPKWRSASPPPSAKINPGGDKSLEVILANVEALLSQSPPSLIEHLEPDVTGPPLFNCPPFQVSFTLDVDDNDDDVMASDPKNDPMTTDSAKSSVGQENRTEQSASKGKKPAGGLTWDAIFDDEEENHCDDSKQVDQMGEEIKIASGYKAEENPSCGDDMRDEVWEWTDGVKDDPQMDNSLDLFGDEEAFLQMTIPDVPTPAVSPRTSPAKQAAQNPCRSTEAHGDDAATNPIADSLRVRAQKAQNTTVNAVTSDLQVQQSSFDKSHDLFSVNFDLGYSLDDSDEDRGDDPGPWASASALPLKQADSSTPCSYFHEKPLKPKEPKLSTPQMSSEHRRRSVSSFFASPPKGEAFPSPITSTRARRMILPGPSSPHTPSVLSSLKRRRLSDQVNQESVCAEPLPPHPGRF